MLRVAIIGVGAMGCLFAGRLTPVAEVTMLGHWASQIAALRRGLLLITPDGQERQMNVSVTDDARRLRPVSLAIVLVKSYQTSRSAPEIRALLDPDGLAITLQNGVSNEQTLASELGDRRVAVGTTTEGATLVKAGVVRHAGQGVTLLPLLTDGRAALVDAFAGVLRSAGFHVELSATAEARVWEKLAINAAINPLTALVDAPNGLLIDNPAANQLARLAATEAALVARAKGLDVDPRRAATRTLDVAMATRQNTSSMLQDVRHGRNIARRLRDAREDVRSGRPTELEAISGSVIKQGREHDVRTPVNAALHRLLTLKLEGEDWRAAVAFLPPNLQPIFIELPQEGTDGKL